MKDIKTAVCEDCLFPFLLKQTARLLRLFECLYFGIHCNLTGQILFDDLKKRLLARGASRLKIVSDPNAEGFYQKMGAVKVGEEQTKIEGRVFPVFELTISE